MHDLKHEIQLKHKKLNKFGRAQRYTHFGGFWWETNVNITFVCLQETSIGVMFGSSLANDYC